MKRRTYLASLASGAAALTAGCAGAPAAGSTPGTPTPARTPPGRLANVDLPVPKSEMVQAIHSVIPAIVEPAFADDWSGVEIEAGAVTYEPRLSASTPVIGVERNGAARAYPLGVLERHEVVNDRFPAPRARRPTGSPSS